MKQALHERIRSDFESRIRSGQLQPGDKLPIELDLMAQYGCSRMTVNKALGALSAAGLIVRRKRAGTFVARPRVHSMVLDIPDLAEQIRGRGQTYQFELLSHCTSDSGPSPKEDKALSSSCRHIAIEGRHKADGVPFALESRLVNEAAVPEFNNADFTDNPPGSWLLHHVPWTAAETRISAVASDEPQSRLLGVATGTACLQIERRTRLASTEVTWVRLVFLGDAYDLIANFGPDGTPAGGAENPVRNIQAV